jgi:hypothetical protein
MQWLKFDIFGHVSTKTLPTPYPKDKPTQYWFATRNSMEFTQMEKIWYISEEVCVYSIKEKTSKRIKIIPSLEYFDKNFSEISLAHWIMGDGYWNKAESTLFICKECFCFKEVQFCVLFLEQKFSYKAGLQRRILKDKSVGYRIRFSKKDVYKIQGIPYMHQSLLYNIGL